MSASRVRAISAALLIAVALSGCTGSDGTDGSDGSTAAPPATTSTPSGSPAPDGRLVAVPSGTGSCIDGVAKGDTTAFTGPGLEVRGGPVTVTGVSFGGTDLVVTGSRSVLFTNGTVRRPTYIVADGLAGLRPLDEPYVADSEGKLVGGTFQPGDTGVMPLLALRVNWQTANQTGQLIDLRAVRPDLVVTYTGASGAKQTLKVRTPISLHSSPHGCH